MSLRMWRTNGPTIDVTKYNGHFDLSYGFESKEQKLDIFLPESNSDKKYPVVISIHGGGYVACDKRNEEMITPMLKGLDRGYAVVGVNYRLAPESHFPQPVQDIKQAIRFLRARAEEYQLDTEHIVTWGGSAGGYMTLMSCLFENDCLFDNPHDPNLQQSAAINGAVAWYPQTDFSTSDEELKINSQINRFLRKEITDIHEEYEPAFPSMEENEFPFHEAPNGVVEKFLGVPLGEASAIIQQASPINYLKKGVQLPALLIQHGSDDEILPMQQSIRFAIQANEACESNNVQLEIIPHAIHSSVLFETEKNLNRVFDFIDTV
ncbi:alpha/beta hydrolase fold domain-containing protein [Enterococcus sp. AZ109]|uniref:alpha/beta hydrolase fold domain-containing protein n=1 Tax=Enterococcus sp. AZ109 TaxID=2774634 RepID=UPI003F24EF89